MFLDKVKIKIQSGSGGNGMVAWRREKYVDKGGPAGGDGGKGGDVYFIAAENMSTLMDFAYKSIFKADSGEHGRAKSQHGKGAKDLYIKVPLGTIVRDLKNGKIIADLTQEGQSVLVAQGGRGGRGNARFATAQKRAPQFCEPGEAGIERELELELKLIADIGLLGMPNAGKSTFISVISAVKPKIADYPFTTLIPNLGVVKKPDGETFVVADIPGLIEGASKGVGLGHEFLRHVERCRFLIHIIDLTAENPIENYKNINKELKKYTKNLSEVYQILVLNKIDIIDNETQKNYFKKFKKLNPDIFLISAVTQNGVKELMNFVNQKITEIPKPNFDIFVEEDSDAKNNDDSAFEVINLGKGNFSVEGGKVNRLIQVTDQRNLDQVYRLENIMDDLGVFTELKKQGCKEGNTIKVGHIEFIYYERT